jgi:hypothetical protein
LSHCKVFKKWFLLTLTRTTSHSKNTKGLQRYEEPAWFGPNQAGFE